MKRTYCFKVDSSGGVQRSSSATSVVGFELLATGRRRRRTLLEISDSVVDDVEEADLVKYLLYNASWTTSGEVCRSLVYAYRSSTSSGNQQLTSVLDRHYLKECLHNRLVTNYTINLYNWTLAPDDSIFLTWQTLANAMLSPAFVIQVLQNPSALFFYVANTAEWMVPLKNIFAAVDNYMVYIMHHLEELYRQYSQSQKRKQQQESQNSTTNSSFSEFPNKDSQTQFAYRDALERHRVFARDVMPFMHATSIYFSTVISSSAAVHTSDGNSSLLLLPTMVDIQHVLDAEKEEQNRKFLHQIFGESGNEASQQNLMMSNDHNESNNDTISPASRSILDANSATDWKLNLAYIPPTIEVGAVQAYSSLIASAGIKNAMLPEELAERWLGGPFEWPPLDVAAQFSTTCPVGETLINILVATFTSLAQQLTDPKPVNSFYRQRANSTFPAIHRIELSTKQNTTTNKTTSFDTKPQDSVVATTFSVLKSLITDVAGIDMAYVVGFFAGPLKPEDGTLTLAKLIKQWTSCDFQNVMDCQKKRTNTFVGILAVVLWMVILYAATGTVGAFVLGGVSVPAVVMWYTYGYSPSCIPMIPTCVVEDVFSIFAWIVPLQFVWPTTLQKIPGQFFSHFLHVFFLCFFSMFFSFFFSFFFNVFFNVFFGILSDFF